MSRAKPLYWETSGHARLGEFVPSGCARAAARWLCVQKNNLLIRFPSSSTAYESFRTPASLSDPRRLRPEKTVGGCDFHLYLRSSQNRGRGMEETSKQDKVVPERIVYLIMFNVFGLRKRRRRRRRRNLVVGHLGLCGRLWRISTTAEKIQSGLEACLDESVFFFSTVRPTVDITYGSVCMFSPSVLFEL